jgi:hypothetical protein
VNSADDLLFVSKPVMPVASISAVSFSREAAPLMLTLLRQTKMALRGWWIVALSGARREFPDGSV